MLVKLEYQNQLVVGKAQQRSNMFIFRCHSKSNGPYFGQEEHITILGIPLSVIIIFSDRTFHATLLIVMMCYFFCWRYRKVYEKSSLPTKVASLPVTATLISLRFGTKIGQCGSSNMSGKSVLDVSFGYTLKLSVFLFFYLEDVFRFAWWRSIGSVLFRVSTLQLNMHYESCLSVQGIQHGEPCPT